MGAGVLQQFPLFVCTYTQKQTVCRLVARTQRTYVIYRENSWVPSCREERGVQKGIQYARRKRVREKRGGRSTVLFLVFPSLFRHRHSLRYKFPSGGRRLNVWTLDWRTGGGGGGGGGGGAISSIGGGIGRRRTANVRYRGRRFCGGSSGVYTIRVVRNKICPRKIENSAAAGAIYVQMMVIRRSVECENITLDRWERNVRTPKGFGNHFGGLCWWFTHSYPARLNLCTVCAASHGGFLRVLSARDPFLVAVTLTRTKL